MLERIGQAGLGHLPTLMIRLESRPAKTVRVAAGAHGHRPARAA